MREKIPRPVKRVLRPPVEAMRWLVRQVRRLLRPFKPERLATTATWLGELVRAFRRRRAEPRLTVAVDATPLWEPLTGVGWSLFRLIEAVADSDEVRLRLYGPTTIATPDLVAPSVPLPSGPAIEHVLRQVPEGLSLPRGWVIERLRRLEPLLLAADGNRVLYASNYFLPRRFALARGQLVAMIHDLGLRKVPWTLADETRQQLERHLDRTLSRARALMTPSESVRAEIVEAGLAPAANVTAVLHGPGQIAATPPGELPPDLPPSFVLHVGTVEPRKNLAVVLDAWQLLLERGRQPPVLVLVGKYGWKAESVRERIEAGEAAGWARALGYVDEAGVSALYRRARAVVMPTLYEGFGLPAIEALSVGTPLVASDIPVLREVAGDAALFAPADAAADWADQIVRLEEDATLRQRLAQRGPERAADFDWQRSGRQALSVWSRVADRESSP